MSLTARFSYTFGNHTHALSRKAAAISLPLFQNNQLDRALGLSCLEVSPMNTRGDLMTSVILEIPDNTMMTRLPDLIRQGPQAPTRNIQDFQ